MLSWTTNSFLIQAGRASTFGIPNSPGVTGGFRYSYTNYNNIDQVELSLENLKIK